MDQCQAEIKAIQLIAAELYISNYVHTCLLVLSLSSGAVFQKSSYFRPCLISIYSKKKRKQHLPQFLTMQWQNIFCMCAQWKQKCTIAFWKAGLTHPAPSGMLYAYTGKDCLWGWVWVAQPLLASSSLTSPFSCSASRSVTHSKLLPVLTWLFSHRIMFSEWKW